jgi:uncharacterized membrane protein
MTAANRPDNGSHDEPTIFSAIITPHRSLSGTGFVALVYWAFRANYRAAAAYEEVTVTASELRLRRVSHRGAVKEWSLNPVWTQLAREQHAEFGLLRLFLVSRGGRLPIAGFLSPKEKESFATALASALGEAKRGPTRAVV